jgi:oligopeptidase B
MDIHISISRCWSLSNRTVQVLYARLDGTGRSYQLLRHTFGVNSTYGEDDPVIYHESNERFVIRIGVSSSRRYFLLTIDGQITREVLYLRTDNPMGQFKPIAPRQTGVRYEVSHHGSYFYILTNEGGAKNYKVVKAHVDAPADKENWEEVLPAREDVLIERIDLFRHHFVTWEWENALQKIRIQVSPAWC